MLNFILLWNISSIMSLTIKQQNDTLYTALNKTIVLTPFQLIPELDEEKDLLITIDTSCSDVEYPF